VRAVRCEWRPAVSGSRAHARLGAGGNLPKARMLEASASPRVTLQRAHIVTKPAAGGPAARSGRRRYSILREGGYADRNPRLRAFACTTSECRISISAYNHRVLVAVAHPPGNLHMIPPGVDLPSDPRTAAAPRPTILRSVGSPIGYKGHECWAGARGWSEDGVTASSGRDR